MQRASFHKHLFPRSRPGSRHCERPALPPERMIKDPCPGGRCSVGLVRLLSNPFGGLPDSGRPHDSGQDSAEVAGRSSSEARRRTARRLTVDEVHELAAAYRAGATVPGLVQRFGIGRTTALAHLERLGIPRRPCVAKLTEHDLIDVADRYVRGQSLASIATTLDVSAQTVRRALLGIGVKMRPRPGWPTRQRRTAGPVASTDADRT